MRGKQLLAIIGLSMAILMATQLISPLTKAFVVEAYVDIKPDTLNLNMEGRWITAYLQLPEGYKIGDVDVSTILLEGLFNVETSSILGNVLILKFDARSVIDYLWSILYHMGGERARVELTIEGRFTNGTDFSGSDTIIIMNPISP